MSTRPIHLATAARLAVLVLPLISTLACGDGSSAEAASTPVAHRDTAHFSAEAVRLAAITVAPAESLPWREVWSAPARLTLDPALSQSLGAIAEGRVTRVLARVGDQVRAGQVLVAIHSHEMMDALSAVAKATAADAQAAAESTLAASTAARAERLHALRSLSLAELERARTALAQATAARAQAHAELARARAVRDHLVGAGAVPPGTDEHEVLVRSPIDGVVVGRDAQPGAVVLVGTPLVAVSRATSLVLSMHLPERAVGAATPGATIRFTVAAFPGETFAARVARIAPTLDSSTRTLEVQAQVEGASDRLRAEMYASAELSGALGAPTLVVPAPAVQALDGDTVVITARPHADGLTLEAVPVRIGRRTAERAEVLAGLPPGTSVVAGGAAVARAELLRRRGGA
jgi:cobalt-zinc-cadmium efflux system membrane fusion protein